MTGISIIIATYNRCDDLRICLESLCSQDGLGQFDLEVIIADNNSNDGTKELVHNFAAQYAQFNIRHVFEGQQGKSYALNSAIKQAQGEFIAFLDDDVILEKDWLVKIAQFIEKTDFDAACGRIMPKFHPDGAKWLKDNVDLVCGPFVSYDYGTEDKPYDNSTMIPVMGANLIVKRYLFDELGDFNTKLGPGTGTFGDDTEISIRWAKAGKTIYYAGTVAVWHPTPKSRMTLKYIADWNMAYGKYTVIKDDGESDGSVVRLAGVPRYLYRKVISGALCLVLTSLNKRKFLDQWVEFYRDLGAVRAHRQYFLNNRKS